MASPALVLAAQTNGRKSKGPKTADGKRKSSANSRRHGLFSKTLPFDDECEGDYLYFRERWTLTRHPDTQVEHALVDTMALAYARHCWALRTFHNLLSAEVLASPDPQPDFQMAAHEAFLRKMPVADRLVALGSRFFRQYERAQKNLEKLKMSNRTESNWGPGTFACAPSTAEPAAAPEKQKMNDRTESAPAAAITNSRNHARTANLKSKMSNRTDFSRPCQSIHKNLLSNSTLAFPKLNLYTEISGNAPQLHRPTDYDRCTRSKHYGRSIRPRLRLGHLKKIRGHQRGKQPF